MKRESFTKGDYFWLVITFLILVTIWFGIIYGVGVMVGI